MPTVPHAINRALERYGLKLTHDDLINLCHECMKGYGRLSFLPDGKERHILLCHAKAVIVVYAPYDGPYGRVKQAHGKIITVLPPEAATSRSEHSPAKIYNKGRFRPRKKPPKKLRQQKQY